MCEVMRTVWHNTWHSRGRGVLQAAWENGCGVVRLVFETSPFDRSGTPPDRVRTYHSRELWGSVEVLISPAGGPREVLMPVRLGPPR